MNLLTKADSGRTKLTPVVPSRLRSHQSRPQSHQADSGRPKDDSYRTKANSSRTKARSGGKADSSRTKPTLVSPSPLQWHRFSRGPTPAAIKREWHSRRRPPQEKIGPTPDPWVFGRIWGRGLRSAYRERGSPPQTIHGDARPPWRMKGVACETGPPYPHVPGCNSPPREAIVFFALKEEVWQL
jgi:hypothetical protein